MHILILNLVAFAQTGGVEKVSRILAKAGCDIALETGKEVLNLSLYDHLPDTSYATAEHYKGFKQNKFMFAFNLLKHGKKAEHLILTHINLSFPALLIKLINPSVKIHLIAHGIEIWAPLTKWQERLTNTCHQILAVSHYTKQRIADRYPQNHNKIRVLNNCLDPFYIPETFSGKPQHLLNKYRIGPDEKVLVTLCRLSSSEKYKGYDTVLKAISALKATYNLKYLLLGKYDQKEYKRLLDIIEKESLEDQVILAGFISETALSEHLLLGDIFIMPSIKEGFGIAFIEAAAAGLPLIAGNKDGSVDALLNGKLGELVDPNDITAVRNAIQNILEAKPDPARQQALVLEHFSYNGYKNKLKAVLGLSPAPARSGTGGLSKRERV